MMITERANRTEHMVDRPARNRACAAIEAFLDGTIGSFELDTLLFDIESRDETVHIAVGLAWMHYDDLKDHRVALTPDEWNNLQRLLLILRSEAHIELIEGPRQWRWSQSLAVLGVVIATGLAIGTESIMLGLAAGWGLFSLIEMVERQRVDRSTPTDQAARPMAPFASLAELRAVRRSVPDFRKRRCPKAVAETSIRTPAEEAVLAARSAMGTVVVSCFTLLLLALPTRVCRSRVTLPATAT